jgi:hypothetical protein
VLHDMVLHVFRSPPAASHASTKVMPQQANPSSMLTGQGWSRTEPQPPEPPHAAAQQNRATAIATLLRTALRIVRYGH